MLLDALSTRYHCLPSETLARADTLDVLVMDVAVAHERQQREEQDRQMALKNGQLPDASHIPLNTLQDMVDRVKKR